MMTTPDPTPDLTNNPFAHLAPAKPVASAAATKLQALVAQRNAPVPELSTVLTKPDPMSLLDEPFFPVAQSATAAKSSAHKLGYVHQPDVIALSYSRLNSLHTCPRKFLLKELQQRKSDYQSVDLSYGSAFGAGIQELFRSGDIDLALVAAFAAWDYPEFTDIWDSSRKEVKSFWFCAESLETFYANIFPQLWQDYELAYIDGHAGIELFVYIGIGKSYSYQVHIDLVLASRVNGALVVVEVKTSGMQQQEANWGNADQTLGYYAIIETLSRKLGIPMEPRVLYITQTCTSGILFDSDKSWGFQVFDYEKTAQNSTEFILNLLTSVDLVEIYVKHNFFPKRGNSCVSYGRPCEFYGMCDMETLINGASDSGQNYASLTLDDCNFVLDLDDMITTLGGDQC